MQMYLSRHPERKVLFNVSSERWNKTLSLQKNNLSTVYFLDAFIVVVENLVPNEEFP